MHLLPDENSVENTTYWISNGSEKGLKEVNPEFTLDKNSLRQG